MTVCVEAAQALLLVARYLVYPNGQLNQLPACKGQCRACYKHADDRSICLQVTARDGLLETDDDGRTVVVAVVFEAVHCTVGLNG